jgi:prepilin peptidase CpaA
VDKLFLACAVVFAVAGAIVDARTRRIPNRLTYLGLVVALSVRVFVVGWPGLRDGLIGALIGGGLFLILFLVGGMGAGDVKLMAAVSAWAGSAQVANLLAATVFAGGAMAIALMLYRRRALVTLLNTVELIRHHLATGLRPHPKLNIKEPSSMRIPFAPAIAIGALYCFGGTFFWG